MCKNIGMGFIDDSRFINPKLHLNLKDSPKLQNALPEFIKNFFLADIAKHKAKL